VRTQAAARQSGYLSTVGDDSLLIAFARAIARGDRVCVSSLAGDPVLALARLTGGEEFYLEEIEHQVYAGDTALHIAAATYEAALARELIDAGAITTAANRRGAVPLHYAVDGNPCSARWNPAAQQETVLCLAKLGADTNAIDKNGTTPLHRAVRNRCAGAVKALLEAGADPYATNRSGSTAMQLARWTTGRGGSGSAEARAQQAEILGLLRCSLS
jgi:hypothetical protein